MEVPHESKKRVLEKISISCAVHESSAWAEVVWEFHLKNENPIPLCAEIVFPVPECAAISKFSISSVPLSKEALPDKDCDPVFCGCHEVVCGVLTISSGSVLPDETVFISVSGVVPIFALESERELILPLGLNRKPPAGDHLLRKNQGKGIYSDTHRFPKASLVSPPIETEDLPILALRVELPRHDASATSLSSRTHNLNICGNLQKTTVSLLENQRNCGDTFRLHWSVDVDVNSPRALSTKHGQHAYHIVELTTPSIDTRSRGQLKLNVAFAWFDSMSPFERDLALDCLPVLLASLPRDTEIQIFVLARETYRLSECHQHLRDIDLTRILSRIRALTPGPDVEVTVSDHKCDLWIGPAPCRFQENYDSVGIFVGMQRYDSEVGLAQMRHRAIQLASSDSPSRMLPSLIRLNFGSTLDFEVSGTLGAATHQEYSKAKSYPGQHLQLLVRTGSESENIEISFTENARCLVQPCFTESSAPRLLWARQRAAFSSKDRDKETIFQEMRDLHDLLLPGQYMECKDRNRAPRDTHFFLHPMP